MVALPLLRRRRALGKRRARASEGKEVTTALLWLASFLVGLVAMVACSAVPRLFLCRRSIRMADDDED
jgi:hypothetical protein